MYLRLKFILFAILLVPFLFSPSGAQVPQAATAEAAETEKADAPAGVDDLQRLVDVLEDGARRDAFVSDLKALIAAQKQTEEEADPPIATRLLEFLSAKIDRSGERITSAIETVLDLPRLLSWLHKGLADPEQRIVWLWIVAKLTFIVAVGLIAQVVSAALLRGPISAIEAQPAGPPAMRWLLAAARAFLDIVGIVAFVAASYGVMTVLDPIHHVRVVTLALINAIAGSRLILTFARMLFSPRIATLRLAAVTDETANYIYLWFRRLTYVVLYGYFGIGAIFALGAPRDLHDVLMRFLGLAVCLLLIMLVLQNRQAVANEIRRERKSLVGRFVRRLADIWHLLAITYLITIFGVWTLEVPGGFEFILQATLLSFVIVIVAHGLVLLAGRLIHRGFSLSDEQKRRFPGLEARANRYLPLLLVVSRVIIYGFAALAFLQTWGFNVFEWFTTPLGAAFLSQLLTIGFVIVVALIAWEVISAAIERFLTATDAEGNVIHQGQRIQTLLPLLRNVVLIIIAVMVTLTVLSELGVDTGALIAGAGIIGLAVGFGAQTFVKDVITGFFILVEDAIAVGDLVELAGHRGRVEAMSIRSVQLRDLKGEVHRVPFSEVTSTINRSKVFSFAIFDIGVAYREDVDHCMNVIREVGDEIAEDPVFSHDILENIEIMGVESFADSAVVIRARIKVKPGKQLRIQRGFNRLLKSRFDAEGIEIPFPHRTIYFGVDSKGEAPPAFVQMLTGSAVSQPQKPDSEPPVQLTQRPEGEQSAVDEVISDDAEREAEQQADPDPKPRE